MKNNQGFTLIGLMAIAAMLSLITVAGMSIAKYNANKQEAAANASRGNQLVSNVVSSNGNAALQGSGNMEYKANLGNLQQDPQNANNPTSLNNQNNPVSELNPLSPANPNNLANASNPIAVDSGCPSPCHMYTDPDNHTASCILSDIDCKCLGSCPAIPAGCTFTPDGPGDPKYQPAPDGKGVACPNTPTCTPPYVVSPRYHECRCPGDVSDCVPFGGGATGGSHLNQPANAIQQNAN